MEKHVIFEVLLRESLIQRSFQMFQSKPNGNFLNITQRPGAEKGEFLLHYLSDDNRKFNLVVTAAGNIVLHKPVNMRSGMNELSLNLNDFQSGVFEVSLLGNNSVQSQKVTLS